VFDIGALLSKAFPISQGRLFSLEYCCKSLAVKSIPRETDEKYL
jgi:hypothetical protein